MIKEPPDSTYRFWLASCVEAFLRGASHAEQLFAGAPRTHPCRPAGPPARPPGRLAPTAAFAFGDRSGSAG